MPISPAVGDALARLGRTEDLCFSPAGDRLAIAGLLEHRILVLDLARDEDGGIAVPSCVEVASPALCHPHGVAWADAGTLAVASRSGDVAILPLPGAPRDAAAVVEPLRVLRVGEDLVQTPGSVSLLEVAPGLVELLVCNNYVHNVSRHLLDARAGFAPLSSEILVEAGLEVPDGIAHSPSGRWLAVSNHDRHMVFLYRNDGRLGPGSAPDGVLVGISYPHGLCFAGEEALIVADAGAPDILIYRAAGGDWAGERAPDAAHRVLDDGAFARGHVNDQDGGPKGVALSPDRRLLATTCQEAPLAFFDAGALLGEFAAPAAAAPDERAREALLRYVEAGRSRADARVAAARSAGDRELKAILASRSWRVTAPLRNLHGAIGRAARR